MKLIRSIGTPARRQKKKDVCISSSLGKEDLQPRPMEKQYIQRHLSSDAAFRSVVRWRLMTVVVTRCADISINFILDESHLINSNLSHLR